VRFWADADDSASDRPLLSFLWTIDGQVHRGSDTGMSFSEEGMHSFTLTVTDAEGAAATVRGVFSVTNPAPRLAASVGTLRTTAGVPVNFSACATDTASDNGNLTFRWTFGDGSRSSEPAGAHSYDFAGEYAVKVTVEDDEGASSSQSFTVTVELAPPKPRPGGPGNTSALSPTIIAGIATAALACAAAAVLLRQMRRNGP
jgi:PKD repeat protein